MKHGLKTIVYYFQNQGWTHSWVPIFMCTSTSGFAGGYLYSSPSDLEDPRPWKGFNPDNRGW